MNSNSFYPREIEEDDLAVDSSPYNFSARIVYPHEFPEDRDVVYNEAIAVKLGLVLLESYYDEHVYKEKPYHVALLDSVWVIETSLVPPQLEIDSSEVDPGMEIQPLFFGGVGHVEINKHNGKVYTVYHTK